MGQSQSVSQDMRAVQADALLVARRHASCPTPAGLIRSRHESEGHAGLPQTSGSSAITRAEIREEHT